MKLRIASSILLSTLTSLAFANPPIQTVTVTAPGKFYIGAFGGAGSAHHFNASQHGTAFFSEAQGGPLAVNAFGELDNPTAAFFGVQMGYQAQDIVIYPFPQWTLGVAGELEGFAINKNTFKGILDNNTDRIDEHDFAVSYPIKRSVFLANAVLNFNYARFPVRPYVGFGMGSALVRMSGADSIQTNPPEAGINHYNSKTSDTTSTFAAQIKPGLIYDINKCLSIFAEYRWLYIANSQLLLGSTVYPTHVPTSAWQVKLDAQKYNLGSIGIRYNW